MLQKPIAQGLYEIAFSARQKAVFVASAGGRGEGATPARILRLDPQTLEITAEAALPGRGFGLALDDARDRLYVSDATDASVTAIDTVSGSVIGQVRLAEKVKDAEGRESFPFHCRELAVEPETGRVFAPCHSFADSVLCVIDPAGLVVSHQLRGFGFVVAGVAVDPGSERLYLSNAQGQVITLDRKRLEITSTVETAGDQLMNLALDGAGGRIFATDQGHAFFDMLWQRHLPGYQRRGEGAQVLVIEAATGMGLAQIPTTPGTLGVLHDAGRKQLWVTERVGQSVSLFDSESYALRERFAFDGHPNSLALDPASGAVFVTLKQLEGAPPNTPDTVARIALAG